MNESVMNDSAIPGPAEPIAYCESWNGRRNRVGIPLTEDEARARNASGDTFYAVLPPRPGGWHPVLVAVVWKNEWVQVQYYDQFGREYLSYGFKRHDAGMFLQTVWMWDYADDNPDARLNDAVRIETFTIRPDGFVTHEVKDKVTHEKTTTRYSDVPVDDMWEPVPEFGDYTSIAELNRRPQLALGQPRS
jgi:hypothetical protein